MVKVKCLYHVPYQRHKNTLKWVSQSLVMYKLSTRQITIARQCVKAEGGAQAPEVTSSAPPPPARDALQYKEDCEFGDLFALCTDTVTG